VLLALTPAPVPGPELFQHRSTRELCAR
jgi:hypothetical protein